MAFVNVFGGHGFVGSEYCRASKDGLIKNHRNNYEVSSANCVYFISTVDNYNVHFDNQLDINTNLVVLMKVLDSYRKYVQRTGEKGTFNFISSWFVYGQDSGFGSGSVGISEDAILLPRSNAKIDSTSAIPNVNIIAIKIARVVEINWSVCFKFSE